MERPESPFPFGKVAYGDHFADREAERARLALNFRMRTNTVLVSPRRWGKTSLLRRAGEDMMRKDKRVRFCHIDLFKVRNEHEFFELYARSVLAAVTTKWEERVAVVRSFLKHLVPFIQVGTEPTSEVSINLRWEDVKKDPTEILDLAERIAKSRKITLVVCVDEFQNIERFADGAEFQKTLRAHWQHHRHAVYCLYGSKRHLMLDMFTRSHSPFYKFGDVMFLEKIARKHWVKYIQARFKKTGKRIAPEVADAIAARMGDHPYAVQQLAWASWVNTRNACTMREVEKGMSNLLDQNNVFFQMQVDNLSYTQLNYLKALLSGETAMSAGAVMKHYKMGTSANVSKIKMALQDRDILDLMGEKAEWTDPLFAIWLTHRYWTPGELRRIE